MRADVSGPSARRALGSVCAGAAARLQEDENGLDLVVLEMLATSTTDDVVDAALLTSAEIFNQIASVRSLSPVRLTALLATALDDLSRPLSASTLRTLSHYLDGDFSRFSSDCELLVETVPASELVRSCVEILAAALRWRSQDQGTVAVDDVRTLCLSVARFSSDDV